MTKSFEDFIHAVALSESSNRYDIKNKFGFLGRYQFGMPRLTDLGLCERAPPQANGKKGIGFVWKDPHTEESFLADAALQDETFRRHVFNLRDGVSAQYGKHLGRTIDGIPVTLSGCIGVCHLLGLGGLGALLVDGENRADANGTRATDYLKKFAGYEIPEAANG